MQLCTLWLFYAKLLLILLFYEVTCVNLQAKKKYIIQVHDAVFSCFLPKRIQCDDVIWHCYGYLLPNTFN